MKDDRALDVDWVRGIAIDRLGAALIEMAGGHSPFFAHPIELSDVLADVADSSVR